MPQQRYSVNQYQVQTILTFVSTGEFAIPEIQRPFVWDATKVRNLMDSLYQGYPVGYLICWKNPDVTLRDGTKAAGKKILIDGQQRVTALRAAIADQPIVNKDYQQVRIQIAFHPIMERFEVFNAAVANDPAWIPSIAPIVSGNTGLIQAFNGYLASNPNADRRKVEEALSGLSAIAHKQVGLIELEPDLDIETVTEIFIRINSAGVVLSQADFAMSKIAANEAHGGNLLRKCIDYFCHLAVAPEFYGQISANDADFRNSPYFSKIAWLKNENDDLYDPGYGDVLRVSFVSQFGRGKLSDLVSLLSGRNFATKAFEEKIVEETFAKLSAGVLAFVNETNFKKFVMIVESAGFIAADLIRSRAALNFAYIIYLCLKARGTDPGAIESHVRRWLVMSLLTSRYSVSTETMYEQDIRDISERDFREVLGNVEAARMSEAFWTVELVQNLITSSLNSPHLGVLFAAQVHGKEPGFLSKDIAVASLIEHMGDVHHVFPRQHLKEQGLTRSQYNQVANFVYMQSEINIKIGKKAPSQYFTELRGQCTGGTRRYGAIEELDEMRRNLDLNCIPRQMLEEGAMPYDDFLQERRRLIAAKIRAYYERL